MEEGVEILDPIKQVPKEAIQKPSVQEIPHYIPKPREQELQQAEIDKLHRIKGSPRVWYVDIDQNTGGVFKQKYYKDKIISDIEHERAAYLISDIVGFDFVPITVLKSINNVEGCLQEFVEDGLDVDEVDMNTMQDEMYKYWIFRHILRNPDGQNHNLLIRDGSVVSIDHDASFDSDTPEPSYYDIDRNYYGVPAPEDLIEIFRGYLSDEKKQAILQKELSGLISDNDRDITMRRIRKFGYNLVVNGQINSPEDLTGDDLW